MNGTKRDCSAQLEAAIACWGAGDRAAAKNFWSAIPDALLMHHGRGDAASWLRAACYIEPMLEDMIEAGILHLSDVLTNSFNSDYAWMESSKTCEWIAKHNPGFLSEIVSFGFSEEDLCGELSRHYSENREIALNYFPVSLRDDIADAADSHFSRDANGWASLLINASQALALAAPSFFPRDISEAVSFLEGIQASPESIESFRNSAPLSSPGPKTSPSP